MIERRRLHFCLRPKVLLTAASISLGLFVVLPLVAFLVLVGGWIAYAACWFAVILMWILSTGLLIGGVLAALGGLAAAKETEGAGCGVAIAGGVAAAIGHGLGTVFGGWFGPVKAAADTASGSCAGVAAGIHSNLFMGMYVYLWSWLFAVAALLAAGAVLAAIGALRSETWIKYSFLKIGYACPKCHVRRLPLFRCSNADCDVLHDDLKPSFFGVWNARCGGCGTKLRTADVLGRLKYEKVCSNSSCSHDLKDQTFGERSEFHVPVVGAVSSGKTNLMIASLWRMEEDFAPANRIALGFASAEEEQEYRQNVEMLQSGMPLPKTHASGGPPAFNVALRRAEGRGARLYLYDAPGEHFQDGDLYLSSHRFERYADAILFLVDPFGEEEVRRQIDPQQARQANAAPTDATEILGRLMPFWERSMNVSAGGRFDVPIAVAVSKADACDLARRVDLAKDVSGYYVSFDSAARHAERNSPVVRRYLEDIGLGNFMGSLESRFSRVAYFACSSLGRNSDPSDASAFQPQGVLAPLVWLAYHCRALSDASDVVQAAWHFYTFFRRALRGLEGTPVQLGAYGFLFVVVSSLLYLFWSLGGILLCLLVFLATAVGAVLWQRYRPARWGSPETVRSGLRQALKARLKRLKRLARVLLGRFKVLAGPRLRKAPDSPAQAATDGPNDSPDNPADAGSEASD